MLSEGTVKREDGERKKKLGDYHMQNTPDKRKKKMNSLIKYDKKYNNWYQKNSSVIKHILGKNAIS